MLRVPPLKTDIGQPMCERAAQLTLGYPIYGVCACNIHIRTCMLLSRDSCILEKALQSPTMDSKVSHTTKRNPMAPPSVHQTKTEKTPTKLDANGNAELEENPFLKSLSTLFDVDTYDDDSRWLYAIPDQIWSNSLDDPANLKYLPPDENGTPCPKRPGTSSRS